jgi:hypothetical protein
MPVQCNVQYAVCVNGMRLRAIITDPRVACPLILSSFDQDSGVAARVTVWGEGYLGWWPCVTYSHEELRVVRHATIIGSGRRLRCAFCLCARGG